MTVTLQDLLDRDEINDCLRRYTRGCDRLDEELVLSAFHPDATIYRGVQNGSREEFVASFWPQQEGREACQHHITNVSVDLDGDSAHVETYYMAFVKMAGDADATMVVGRYLDHFERRVGEWAIAMRVVARGGQLVARGGTEGDPLGTLQQHLAGSRDREDPSYLRPLRAPKGWL